MSWWIGVDEQKLTEDVPAPPDAVRDFYVDLNNIRLVHPLVVAVRTIARTETDDGYVQTYQVHDRIPLGPITLRTRYTARVCVPRAGDVVTEARQFPAVRLNGVVTFDAVDGGTRVVEQLRIRAPRVLLAVTAREAVQAHTEMLANIAGHFAGQL
jgi:Polyketide cyclase / dehydrase and lipid transport